MLYLLGTNISIHLIQRQPHQVLQHFAALRHGQAVMSIVTYAELCAGLEMQSGHRDQDTREGKMTPSDNAFKSRDRSVLRSACQEDAGGIGKMQQPYGLCKVEP